MFQYGVTDRSPGERQGNHEKGTCHDCSTRPQLLAIRFPSWKERKGHPFFHSLSVSLFCKWNKNKNWFTFWIAYAFSLYGNWSVLTPGPYFFSASKYVNIATILSAWDVRIALYQNDPMESSKIQLHRFWRRI